MSYHLRKIEPGVYGEISKIREELEELEDAVEQGVFIMAAVELSDLYGAIEAYASKHGYTMEDLKMMSDVTKRAFTSGSRPTKEQKKETYDASVDGGARAWTAPTT